MSLTSLLLFTLANIARAESGVDDCSESAVLVRSEGAVYVEGVGCVIDDIGELCTATIINIDALLRRHSHSRAPRRGRASA